MHVPFVDLVAGYRENQDVIDAAIAAVMRNGQFVLGAEVSRFEQAFAEFCEIDYCISVANGTDALKLTLEACGIAHSDEVVVPTNSFAASALAITGVGAVPRFVDCCADSFLMDIDAAMEAVTQRTKAFLPVHLYGKLLDTSPLIASGLPIIEDAAQAHGASRGDLRAGSIGAAACFSFYPTKNLGAYGDGGAVVTKSLPLRDTLLRIRNYGQSQKYIHEVIGYNSRLDTMQAAILRAKLLHLNEANARRKQIAMYYQQHLHIAGPVISAGDVHHLYVIRVAQRDELRARLLEAGVETGIHYPLPLHLQPCFAYLGYGPGDFPIAERLAGEIVSLPMYPQLTTDQLDYTIELVNRFAVPADV